ncbi:MAG TPA: MFS transporter [Acidimicrobiales bacterium]|nr:MFS transporter [Acidimicrobiales bacterium]
MARRDAEVTLRRLTVIVGLQWMGATFGLPLLPLFLEHRDGTPTVIGLIMAAFFAAGVVTQFAFGHLADRFGRRRVLVGSLVVYALASMTYLLPVSAPWLALTRAVQGATAGSIEVASLAAVAALVPEARRGRAVSRILAAQLFGIAIGPVAGVVATVHDLGWAFFATGLVSLGVAVVAARTDLGDRRAPHDEPLPPLQWNPQVVGSLIAASASGLTIGVYEACWTLLMHAHHASSLQIRLSWTFFGLPWIVLARFGGWLADHADRRFVALAGMVNGALFLALYPHIHNPDVMLGVGSLESIGAALSVPSVSSMLSQGAASRELGRRQGLYATSNTGALALAAATSGFLFTLNEALPFSVVAALSTGLALAALYRWRAVPGRVTDLVATTARSGPNASSPHRD